MTSTDKPNVKGGMLAGVMARGRDTGAAYNVVPCPTETGMIWYRKRVRTWVALAVTGTVWYTES